MTNSQRIGWICQSSALPVFLMLLKALTTKKGMSLVSSVNLNRGEYDQELDKGYKYVRMRHGYSGASKEDRLLLSTRILDSSDV